MAIKSGKHKKKSVKKKKYTSARKTQPTSARRKFQVKIEDLNEKGEGIAFHDRHKLTINKTLPGEEVLVEYLPHRPRKDRLQLIKILQPAPQRVNSPCTFFEECGGCHLQHMTYEQQLIFKQKLVKRQLLEYPALKNIQVYPVAGMEEPFHYRNKCQMPFQQKGSEVIYGLFRSGTHEVIPINYCLVENRDANRILEIVKHWATTYNIPVYDEISHEGYLRHVVIRKGIFTNQVMVVLVSNQDELPHWKELLQQLQAEISTLHSFQININKSRTNKILSDQNLPVFGESFITEKIGRFKYQIFPQTFFQVNSVQTVRLLEKLIGIAQFKAEETVLDLYSGVGTISLYISPFVKKVIGIEENFDAVKAARQNAEINQILNAEFRDGDATHLFTELVREMPSITTVIVDPPRKGLSEKLIGQIGNSMVEKLIYISCNPRTLVRDMFKLRDFGFTAQAIYPFDMFPQTYHVEALTILKRVMR